MDLYKVLLVDDEEDVRSSIVRKLDWAALGFAVVGEASNGEEALELAEQLAPDVMMTDIKMPFMDGLELCRRVRQLLPGIRLAVFSGFDEFEYAKEAITRQVEEYILKPIDAAELSGVFVRMRQSLDQEIAARRDMERLRLHYEESLPLMRQQLLAALLEGRLDLTEAAERLAAYGLSLDAPCYCAAVVRGEQEDRGGNGEGHLLDLSLTQLISDTLEDIPHHLVHGPGYTSLLFLLEQGQDHSHVTGLLGQLFPISRRLLGLPLSIGVGGVYARPEEIRLSHREALDALEYRLLVEPGQCVYIGDIEPGAVSAQAPDARYGEEVLRQIKVGGENDLWQAVLEMIQHLKGLQTGIQQYRIYLLVLFTELLKLIRTYRLDPAEARQESLLSEGMAMRFQSLDELARWLYDLCANLQLLARRERKDSVRLLVDRARELLLEQYADADLSLDSVCAQLGVSAAYFSTAFKKETGNGFVGYLTDLRMEKALELLATTDDKTYQIAEKIGYTDPNYFSYVFKKRFGVSPSKYRTDRMSPHE